MQLIAVLDNIRSLHNVGSVFRTADALGIAKLYLCGETGHPHPDEPWRRDHLALQKTALGAEKTVAWEYASDTPSALWELKGDGFELVSLELTDASQPITSYRAKLEKVCLILGNEVAGISQDVLGISDAVVHIPMRGTKESLNVSVAFGIAAHTLLNS